MKTILYPGSFDPVTNGHLDVAKRAAKLFDRVIIAVAENSGKKPLFTFAERIALLKEACADTPNIEVSSFDGLLVNALKQFGAEAVLRGIRTSADFEYEFQMALMNRKLNAACETFFMMTDPACSFVSSTLVKEIARGGGDISNFVPVCAAEAIRRKLGGAAS